MTGNLDVQSTEDIPLHSARRLYHALRGSRPDSRSLKPLLRDLKQVITSAPETLGMLSTHFLEHRIAIPKGARYFLMANAESEPYTIVASGLAKRLIAMALLVRL